MKKNHKPFDKNSENVGNYLLEVCSLLLTSYIRHCAKGYYGVSPPLQRRWPTETNRSCEWGQR